MKRFVSILICIVLSIMATECFAQIRCDCEKRDCTCFIQRGDKGIAVKRIKVILCEEGYLQTDRGDTFDLDVYHAICSFQRDHLLEETGLIDDETLSMLLSVKQSQMQDNQNTVWVPTDGGKKYHSKHSCSNMLDPRKISESNALILGIEACKRCN